MFVEYILRSICGILNIDSNTRCISRVYDMHIYIYIYIYIRVQYVQCKRNM